MLKKFVQDFILSLAHSSTQVVQVTFLAGSITFSQVALEVGLAPELASYLPTEDNVSFAGASRELESPTRGFFSSQSAFDFQETESSFTWTAKNFDDSELLAIYDQDLSSAYFLQNSDSSQISTPLASSVQSLTQEASSKQAGSFSFFEVAQREISRTPASSQQAPRAARVLQRTKEIVQALASKPVNSLSKDLAPVPAVLAREAQGPVGISASESLTAPQPSAPSSSLISSPTTTVPVAEPQPTTPTTTVPVAVGDQPAEEVLPDLEEPAPPTVQKKKALVISDEAQESAVHGWAHSLGEDQFEVFVIGRGESAPVSFDQFDILILNLNQNLHSSDARALRGLSTPILTCQPNTAVELGFVSVTDQAQPNNKKDIRITDMSHPIFEGLNLQNQVSIFQQLVPVAFAERAIENATVLASWNSSPQTDRTLVFVDAGSRLSQGGASGGHRGFYPCTNLARHSYSPLGQILLRRSAVYLMRRSAE